jgi:nicotinamidase-related amidase
MAMTTPVRLPQDTALLVLSAGTAAPSLREEPLATLIAAWCSADMPRAILTPAHDPVPETDADIPVMTHGAAGIFSGTELDPRLTAAGITTVVLATASDTVPLIQGGIEAASLGYRVIIMSDENAASDAFVSVAGAKIASSAAIAAGVALSTGRKRPWSTIPANTL